MIPTAMTELFRFSPSRLALAYVALSVLVLALFAIPLWYAWSVNLSMFREYVAAALVGFDPYQIRMEIGRAHV